MKGTLLPICSSPPPAEVDFLGVVACVVRSERSASASETGQRRSLAANEEGGTSTATTRKEYWKVAEDVIDKIGTCDIYIRDIGFDFFVDHAILHFEIDSFPFSN